ncbi:UvrD-helicase domain-containing protein [Janibacter sp. GXQ6167]|uniref:UvrD-helicase domain-containing protein n=1 Tax=Janibacter sp. GXQ6167 TaxID=3240791 RepID=UPI00352389F2
MPDELPEALQADVAGFVAALPASVVLPAGTGKTHLLAATASSIAGDAGRVLVLTHTNAGVFAVNSRLKRFGVARRDVHVATITSFAFRLARAYPVLGELIAPKVMIPADSPSYVRAATKVIAAEHIKAVLAATYTHVLVDEYQDCNVDQHKLVLALREAVGQMGILGDPLQAIFGFSDPLPDWDDVIADFPEHANVDLQPHRWIGHNKDLGEWLLEVRDRLKPGATLNLTNRNYPNRVTYTNIAGNRTGLTTAARSLLSEPADETVLIIAANDGIARHLAGELKGTYTVMEEIEGKFMAKWLDKLEQTEPADYASWLFEFTKKCHCGHGALEPKPVGKRYTDRKTGADLLTAKREPIRITIEELDNLVTSPTLTTLAAAMDVIPTTKALRLHSHEAWYDVKTAIRGAIAHGDDKNVLREELAKARDAVRHSGRRERRHIISRTLLVKGLEYDHVLIADIARHLQVNDLYVALTRARKSIHILGAVDTITLVESPR